MEDLLWVLTDDQLKAALHFADSLTGLLKRATEESQKIKGARKLEVRKVTHHQGCPTISIFRGNVPYLLFFAINISKVYKAIKGHKRTAAKESFRIKGCLKIEERKVIVIDCYFYAQMTIAHSSELRVLCLITLPTEMLQNLSCFLE